MIQKSPAITLKDNLESSRRQLFSLRKKIVKDEVLLSDLGDVLPVMVGLNTNTVNQYPNAAAETVFRRSKEEIKLMGKKFFDTYFYKQEYLSSDRYLEQQLDTLHKDCVASNFIQFKQPNKAQDQFIYETLTTIPYKDSFSGLIISLIPEQLGCNKKISRLYQANIKFAYEDISPPEPPSLLEELTYQLVGKKLKKRNEQQKLLAHKETYQSEILAFTRDFMIPFDKNLAELGLRMMKAAVATVKQKVSGTFRCNEGAKMFACIRGYVSTVKKQERNVLEELANVLQENPFQPLWNFNTVTFNFTLILAISYCHFTKI